jgi:Domain of unknown function (DUF397)
MAADEVRAWRKSSRCGESACLEIADEGDQIAIRNATRPTAELVVPREAFTALIRDIRAGELDGPAAA